MKKEIIVSGIQPTGNLHIGNYLGAVQQWVEMQESGQYDMYIFIADLHSLTGDQTPEERHNQIYTTAAELLAAGIDPEKTTLWVQSHVPQCTELAWMFNCVTPVAELERMTQFKDKSSRQKKNINVGLFSYPVLQAADILLYKGTSVPVGKDQEQHVELTRDIGRWFNNKYKEYFPEAKPMFTRSAKVMSLLDPEKKMSKSLGQGHVIELADSPDVIEKKIKKAVTATEGGKASPGVENLLSLLEQFGNEAKHVEFAKAEEDGSIRYGDLKHEVSSVISEHLKHFRERREWLMNDHDEVAEVLIEGAKKASAIAEKTISEVREIIGLR
jgi:tryptophanyl-tRNA synthetase